jgi:hypothetical protein
MYFLTAFNKLAIIKSRTIRQPLQGGERFCRVYFVQALCGQVAVIYTKSLHRAHTSSKRIEAEKIASRNTLTSISSSPACLAFTSRNGAGCNFLRVAA